MPPGNVYGELFRNKWPTWEHGTISIRPPHCQIRKDISRLSPPQIWKSTFECCRWFSLEIFTNWPSFCHRTIRFRKSTLCRSKIDRLVNGNYFEIFNAWLQKCLSLTCHRWCRKRCNDISFSLVQFAGTEKVPSVNRKFIYERTIDVSKIHLKWSCQLKAPQCNSKLFM